MFKKLKTVGQWILGLAVLLLLLPFVLLIYAGLLALIVFLPPFLVGSLILEGRQEYRIKGFIDALYRLSLIFILLPLGLFAFAAPLRSVILLVCSSFPAALISFNELHGFIYDYFIPIFGELFPFWLDFWWGVYGVLVFFLAALFDSRRRSRLLRQIEILPTSKVHSAAIGLTELAGKAVPVVAGDKVIIRKWAEQRENGMSIEKIVNPFYLDDGTGRILIDPGDSEVDTLHRIFSIKLHHIFLREHHQAGKFSEGRLMAGDEVYVLGSVQINHEPGTDRQEDKVVIKPKRSSLLHPDIYDIFFVTNTSEAELLDNLRKSVSRGWFSMLVLLLLTAWLAVYAWCNIVQLKQMDVDAAPVLMQMIVPPTTLERRVSINGMDERTVLYWLNRLPDAGDKLDDIMSALEEQQLQWLAVPALLELAVALDRPEFAQANRWLGKLNRLPEGQAGLVYYYDRQVRENHTLVSRVLLQRDGPRLLASYRAHFYDPESSGLTLKGRYVVFKFTHKETGAAKEFAIWSKAGWNNVDDYELFEYFLPGVYTLELYAERRYFGGARDRGSSTHLPRDIRL